MGYWNKAVREVFSGVGDISESWEEGTVSFQMKSMLGVKDININRALIDRLELIFGTSSITIDAFVDTSTCVVQDEGKRVDCATIIVTFVLSGVKFPAEPWKSPEEETSEDDNPST